MEIIVNIIIIVIIVIGFIVLFYKITNPKAKDLEDFKNWGIGSLCLFALGFIVALMPWDLAFEPQTLSSFGKYRWAAGILLPVLLAIGVTLISISYSSGRWYQVFTRFSDLGIEDANPSREGRRTESDQYWLNLVESAKVVSQGWWKIGESA